MQQGSTPYRNSCRYRCGHIQFIATGVRQWLVYALCVVVPFTALAVELPDELLQPQMPQDLSPDGQPAYTADLEQAAIFAWQEFIALNWPAKSGQRETPADVGFGDQPEAPKVWETMRGRVEVYPGHGEPNGFAKTARDYGYDSPPDYLYAPDAVASDDGRVPACGQGNDNVPWHNLDEESNQYVMAGMSPAEPYPGKNILIESKVNRPGYVYVAARGWYGENSVRFPARRTGRYIRTHFKPPRAASVADDPEDTEYISFPVDSMELKAAWRRLGRYDSPDRFHRSQVRYYRPKGDNGFCFIDSDKPGNGSDQWGLLALHIARKTPSAPYFIWATFEQVDNLVQAEPGADGKAVTIETASGAPAAGVTQTRQVYSPPVRLVEATAETDQHYVSDSMTPPADPKLRLHYYQEPVYDIPEVEYVAVNRRLYPTPDTIQAVNDAVQKAIAETAPSSPFRHYRLVAVQWRPLDKEAGKIYTGPEPPAVYYAANTVIEAPPVHQGFSGQFSHGFSKASDYLQREMIFLNPPPNPGEPVFFNTYHDGKTYLAGGCMGCHGQRQSYGTDWSFLLFRQRVEAPVPPKHAGSHQ